MCRRLLLARASGLMSAVTGADPSHWRVRDTNTGDGPTSRCAAAALATRGRSNSASTKRSRPHPLKMELARQASRKHDCCWRGHALKHMPRRRPWVLQLDRWQLQRSARQSLKERWLRWNLRLRPSSLMLLMRLLANNVVRFEVIKRWGFMCYPRSRVPPSKEPIPLNINRHKHVSDHCTVQTLWSVL